MTTRILLCVCTLLVGAAPPAAAQEKAQVSVWGGWTFTDSVVGNTFAAPNGEIYTQIGTKDSGSWGVRAGVFLKPNTEAGFIYGHQGSELRVSGVTARDIGRISVNTYHGYIGYEFGDSDLRLRPFAFLGLGVTSFGSVDFINITGGTQTIPGATKFSGTFGGGLNLYLSPRVAAQANARWTPTFITAPSNSWWCDPYWGCYLGTGQYFNLVELGGGVSIRF